jgi:hypothetical protein
MLFLAPDSLSGDWLQKELRMQGIEKNISAILKKIKNVTQRKYSS